MNKDFCRTAILKSNSEIEDIAWHQAILMVMSEIPKNIDDPCKLFMELQSGNEIPDGFIPWGSFEYWTLGDLQELISDISDSLISFAKEIIVNSGDDLDCYLLHDQPMNRKMIVVMENGIYQSTQANFDCDDIEMAFVEYDKHGDEENMIEIPQSDSETALAYASAGITVYRESSETLNIDQVFKAIKGDNDHGSL